MFTLFLRGAVLYIAMILVMRGLSKRQLGEFQPFELAMTILLADVISGPMESVSTPLLAGLLPVAAMFLVHSAISMMALKWDRVRAIVSGRPSLVVSRGTIDREALDRLCLSLSDLLEGLRGAGFPDPTRVDAAIVEANGGISAFAGDGESGDEASNGGVPLMLILDGYVQAANLARSGRDRAWLENAIRTQGLDVGQVYLGMLDDGGCLTLQLKRGETLHIQAMKPEEVTWQHG